MNKTIQRIRLAREKILFSVAVIKLLEILADLVGLTFNYTLRVS